jgi:two-component system OmpR family sensor kinase
VSRRRSLSTQLTRTLIVAIGCVWLLMVAASAWQARAELSEAMDSTLVDSSHRLLNLAMHDIAANDLAQPAHRAPQSVGMGTGEPLHEDDHLIYQIVNDAGQVLLRSKDAPELALDVTRSIGFADLPDWRVYTYKHPESPIYIHVAEQASHRTEAALNTLAWLALPMLAALPLLGLLIHALTRRALWPLHRFADEIQQRGGQNLSPIVMPAQPPEIEVITHSTNHLLQRLTEALNVERALTANAAHELRTPLAAALLRMHTLLSMPLGSRAHDEAKQALASLLTLNRRSEKLLQLSRAESSAALAGSAVDLGELATVLAEEFWALSDMRERLHLRCAANENAVVLGDFDTLAIALRNLIENAVTHCNEGAIEVVVAAPGTMLVRDAGCGVTPEALERIRQRHVTQSRHSAGFGLGLSIVTSIVERHGGQLVLSSPPAGMSNGFEAAIHLPTADALWPHANASTAARTRGAPLH